MHKIYWENILGSDPLEIIEIVVHESISRPKQKTMGGIISETSNYRNYRNSLGYSFRFFSTEMVKDGAIRHLKVNNIFPSKESIQSGGYPITAEFYAVTAGSNNPNIEPFIKWILSDQGQNIIEKTGYVPIK